MYCIHTYTYIFHIHRVPQILRVYGILVYAPELAAAIDGRQEVPSGSPEEVELRACTVVAVELLREEMMRRGKNLLSIELDWLLWQKGEAVKDQILPHHRTLTIYY